MNTKCLFARIRNKHKELFGLTKAMKEEFADYNLQNILVLLHLSFLFGFTNFISVIFFNLHDLSSKYRELIYFGMFFAFSIILITAGFFIRKSKKVNYIIKNLLFYTAIAGAFVCFLYRAVVFCQPIVGITLLASVSLIAVIFCNAAPGIFTTMLIFPAVIISMMIYKTSSVANMMDFVLFIFILMMLSHFKRAVTIKQYKYDLQIKQQKKFLEEEYTKQASEIENQAVEILHQNRKLLKYQDDTIISLANLVENRDSDTGEHVRRTSEYVKVIAKAAMKKQLYQTELTDEYVELVVKAAPMHDIGKIVVSDVILKKPGRLTEEEFNQIKRHTVEGGKIVRDVIGKSDNVDYIKIATEVATSHHERWNGAGYPYNLKEIQIPLSARLMAIADVFDALVSKRCYKDSMSYDEAFAEISKGAGTQFDPQLTMVFLENKDEIINIAEKYK